ncbi:helix-turn-helix domain-containing protein [Succinivibrio sp.]|uniref:helix-turn-helix domain-containing protein n=1 Tax=Succinivibrio sp. TaxID=2053619 RepID=UPI0025CC758F|nr:helix-turn-helix transcriptional regulator [Succinivibrio sp.]MBQ9221523.1 helix-turn-helix transcriptional regulator [Succinivibrio sp.]
MSNKFRDILNEKLKDPVFRKDFDDLEPEFSVARAILTGKKEKNLSMKELSQLTGISQAYISKLENGKGNPSLKTLVKLAEVFGKKLQISFV